jgi:glutamate synthase (NADPH/NADH) small chain
VAERTETRPSDNARLSTKERMAIDRQHMPEQPPLRRAHNFDEVNLGLTAELAIREAQRCLLCKHAKCVEGCPVSVDIPAFIDRLASGDLHAAAESLLDDNALPCVTGRVCPQETQCEGACPRGRTLRGVPGEPVAIGYLERYVADWAADHAGELTTPLPTPSGKRVAVVGSGPGGLTAAGELVRFGHAVTVFEAFHTPGGVLVYGIPDFRLPVGIVEQEVQRLVDRGVSIEPNAVIGRTYTLPELRDAYDAVFVAVGAGLPTFMNVPGENLKGVYSANEYLTRVNLMAAYRDDADTPVLRASRVAVVGGGNVAMDAVRTALRLGADEAVIVYRRSRAEMPARAEEVHHAEDEGVRFQFFSAPVEIVGNDGGWVSGLKCVRTELGEPDESGRRRPVPVEGSEFVVPCDVVIVALGTRANPLLTQTAPQLRVNLWGYLEVDEHGQTSMPGVFAGGDIVRGSATVILAMGDGKRAALAIDAYLRGVAPPAESTLVH